jgi:hypothetical protein
MGYVLLFLAGALLCNAVPHLAAGLRGEAFQTPFARPSGVGTSSPLVNFYWGSFNLFVGLLLAAHWLPQQGRGGWLELAIGFLVIGTFTAWHFGKIRGG